eukprot:CAMPEP_0119556278 /NCGR_PEP_ID=MMETSP1352-20130426/8289_1 /TAXON_ID=265584 /ORGANISM="Stauroneis constricta, Strain CCMP1120" /LENGTH=80 /DNA_ID=CAMNT_0007603215 /DNA_START=36 /DNA_END=275 /DNA_ORIENTATION=-
MPGLLLQSRNRFLESTAHDHIGIIQHVRKDFVFEQTIADRSIGMQPPDLADDLQFSFGCCDFSLGSSQEIVHNGGPISSR